MEHLTKKPCRAPFDGMVVHFSGIVYPCDQLSQGPLQKNMQIGDIHKNSIQEIFEGEEIRLIRQNLREGNTKNLLCDKCDKASTCNLYGDPNTGKEGGLLHGGADDEISYSTPNVTRLELAITDLCNMKCTMCSLSRGEASPAYTKKNGFMELQTIKRVIDETVKFSTAPKILLTLHWIGEPLIHPKIVDILEYISLYPRLNLHLVTNGISLTPKIANVLLQMKGTLNVSINARYFDTFRIVNQSSKYDEVHKNLHYFLQRRKEEGKESSWSVIVSSIVLAENYREIPEFVKYWKDVFVALDEEPSISLNGKGQQTAAQIMILQEIELPKSDVYFRQTLRSIDMEHPELDLQNYSVFDDILLHSSDGELDERFDGFDYEKIPIQFRSQQLAALSTHLGEYRSDILEFIDLHEQETRTIIQKQVLEESTKIAPECRAILESYWNPILLSLAFPQYQSTYLQELTLTHLYSQKDALYLLGEILRKNIHLQNCISINREKILNCSFLDREEQELFCVVIGVSYEISQLSEVRKEWLCGYLSEIDSPELFIEMSFSIQSNWDLYLSLFDPNKIHNIISFEQHIDRKTPDWLIRAMRRRILFANIQIHHFGTIDKSMQKSDEYRLLQIVMVRDERGFEQFVMQQMKLGKASSNRWFDILDVHQYLRCNMNQKLIQAMLQYANCPLLMTSIQNKLAMYLLAQVDVTTFLSFFHSNRSSLQGWQNQLGNTYIQQNQRLEQLI
jgi:radical SAM protein with 4Fe4S-binding SPASM domain